jgi:hypothetical protein
VSWAYPGSLAVLVLSRCVSLCAIVSRCIEVVTDIWRTDRAEASGSPNRLIPVSVIIRPPVTGCQSPAEITSDLPVWPTYGPRNPPVGTVSS